MRIRVLIVDSQALLRLGLKEALRHEQDIEIVGEAATGEEALEQACMLSPDVVLIDVAMPGDDGVTATRAIKQRCLKAQILVLTATADRELFRRSVEAGAVGYVLKDISPANLGNAIRAVHSGKTMINPALARQMVDRIFAGGPTSKNIPASQHGGLTEREIEVLIGLAEGLSDKEIAARLLLSESTVKTHLRAIYQRFNFRNRAQAAAFAVQQGLIVSLSSR